MGLALLGAGGLALTSLEQEPAFGLLVSLFPHWHLWASTWHHRAEQRKEMSSEMMVCQRPGAWGLGRKPGETCQHVDDTDPVTARSPALKVQLT